MAELTGKAISELPESTTVNNAALVVLSENGVSKKMTLATLVGNLLKKTGDKMTGILTLANASLVVQDTSITSGTSPSSDIYGRSYYLNDSNGFNLATWQVMSLANGREGFQLVAGKKVNNVIKFNYIRMNVDANGNPYVEMNGAAAWRKALGLCYAANETYSVTSVQLAGYISANSSEVSFTVPVEKSMENISSVSVTTLTGLFRTHNGFVDNVSSSASWLSNYTVSAYKRSNNLVQILVKKSSALANVTPNTVATASVNITLKFT